MSNIVLTINYDDSIVMHKEPGLLRALAMTGVGRWFTRAAGTSAPTTYPCTLYPVPSLLRGEFFADYVKRHQVAYFLIFFRLYLFPVS